MISVSAIYIYTQEMLVASSMKCISINHYTLHAHSLYQCACTNTITYTVKPVHVVTSIHVIAPALRGSLTQMSPQKTTPGYKPFSPAYP